jgi:hypothetical protein
MYREELVTMTTFDGWLSFLDGTRYFVELARLCA